MPRIACAATAACIAFVLIGTGAAFAQDKNAPPKTPPSNAGVFDDSTRPVNQAVQPKATIYDDSVKLAKPKGNPQGTVYDDGVKPDGPKANAKGGVWDDSTKPKPK